MLHAVKNHPFPGEKLIALLNEKKTVPEIAELLHRSRSTVAYHVSKIRTLDDQTEKKDPEESSKRVLELEGEIASVKKALSEALERVKNGEGNNGHPGILRSRVMISGFEGYYDGQKKLISETIKEYIYRAGKGKSITMEVRQLEDLLRVTVEISGGPAE